MKILKITLVVIVLIIGLLLVYGWSIGLFGSVKVEEREAGGYTLAGTDFKGSYAKAGQSMADIDKRLKNMGVICTKGFGIYYDDPKTTPEEKCRSFVGNIIEEKDFDKLSEIQSNGFKIDSVKKSTSLVVEFPILSNLSYIIGPMKAYPALSKYMSEKKYTHTMSLEIYDLSEKKIYYIMQYKKTTQ